LRNKLVGEIILGARVGHSKLNHSLCLLSEIIPKAKLFQERRINIFE